MRTLLDSHVHFHSQFDVCEFLDAAVSNFARASSAIGRCQPTVAAKHFQTGSHVLVICETDPGKAPLAQISDSVSKSVPWSLKKTETNSAVVARNAVGLSESPETELLLVAGRQLVTKERLELLAIGTSTSLQHHLSLTDSIQSIEDVGGVCVLPWGFGKWMFGRGNVVRSLLHSHPSADLPTLLFGDNGCRWQSWRPHLLKLAESAGVPVIAGSDPLKLANHARRAGSFGTVLDTNLDESSSNLAESLCRSLRALKVTPPTFGVCRGLPSFVQDQVSLRLRKV